MRFITCKSSLNVNSIFQFLSIYFSVPVHMLSFPAASLPAKIQIYSRKSLFSNSKKYRQITAKSFASDHEQCCGKVKDQVGRFIIISKQAIDFLFFKYNYSLCSSVPYIVSEHFASFFNFCFIPTKLRFLIFFFHISCLLCEKMLCTQSNYMQYSIATRFLAQRPVMWQRIIRIVKRR